jgi:hypothetical protein
MAGKGTKSKKRAPKTPTKPTIDHKKLNAQIREHLQQLEERQPISTESLKNPFHTESRKPWLAKSWVAYLDILGFLDEIRESSKDGTQAALLNRLMVALTEAKEFLNADNEKLAQFGWTHASYRIKFFTDNIVLGFPVSDDGESEFGQLVYITGLYQFTLIKHGFFTRGGISFGELYMDDDVVFGDGVLEAYEAESKLARDPRVVFAKSGRDLMLSHLAYYARVRETPHNHSILFDSDSQLFINYLVVPTDDMEGLNQDFLDVLVHHRDLIAARLQKFAENPQIRPKYEWAGIYHNHVVRNYFRLPEEYTLKDELILSTPKSLDQVYRRKGALIFKGEQEVARFKGLFDYKRQRRPK